MSPGWLALREPADAAARAGDLVAELTPHLPADGTLVVHDLGCGTGAMGRWLAPRLRTPQRWVLHDRDADLLDLAAVDLPGVTIQTRQTDLARLAPDDLAGASLITASALLDLLTSDELEALVDVCARAACPVLLTLSVVGEVELVPADPLDRAVAAAFDAHQRRDGLLGPDAPAAAAAAFRRRGAEVLLRPSPWRLGAAERELATAWFRGWLGAAREQEPGLSAQTEAYERTRLEQAATGRLAVRVGHADVLALPSAQSRNRGDSA